MTEAARKVAFDDYKLLQNRVTSHILWTPLDLSGYAASENNKREPTITKRQRMVTSESTYSNVTKPTVQINANYSGRERHTPLSSVTTAMEPAIEKPFLELQSKNKELEHKVMELEMLVKESQASMKLSIDNLLTSMNQKDTFRANDLDDKFGELETLVKQSQSTTSSAIRALEKGVGTNDRVVQHLLTIIIPELQHDLQNTKSSLEQKMDKVDKKMDDGFGGIRNMFENMMNQHQGNSLHRADGENLVDVTHKRNRSSSKLRKLPDGSGKTEKNRAESNSRRKSGDSRGNDNLEELTHSDHHMNGTGDHC
jgi:hypothetical protein